MFMWLVVLSLSLFLHSLWSCDQDLTKQKVKIIDFQTICNSIDYAQTMLTETSVLNFVRVYDS